MLRPSSAYYNQRYHTSSAWLLYWTLDFYQSKLEQLVSPSNESRYSLTQSVFFCANRSVSDPTLCAGEGGPLLWPARAWRTAREPAAVTSDTSSWRVNLISTSVHVLAARGSGAHTLCFIEISPELNHNYAPINARRAPDAQTSHCRYRYINKL